MPPAVRPLHAALRRLHLPISARVGVACSGGADSMALLHVARTVWPHMQVLHVDHGTRTGASAEDARFVRTESERLNLDFHCARLRLRSGPGFEARARAARYAAFERLAATHGTTHLLLAHHADDQAETVALRLERGSGTRGLRGVPAVRALTQGIVILRPFLHLSRAQLRAALSELGATHREDATNALPVSRRNVLRKELASTPHRRRELLQLGRDAARAHTTQQRAARKLLPEKSLLRCEGMTAVPLSLLQRAPEELHGALLARLLPEETVLPRRAYASFTRMVRAGHGAADLLRSVRLRIADDWFFAFHGGTHLPLEDVALVNDTAKKTRHFASRLGVLTVRRLTQSGQVERALKAARTNPCCAVLSTMPDRLRTPRRGERYAPLGAPGRRLLSDALRERGVPEPVRALWPLIADHLGVLWGPGLVPAERARVLHAPAWQVICTGPTQKLLACKKAATPPSISE